MQSAMLVFLATMQSTMLVFLAMALGLFEKTSHPVWANLTFLAILVVWVWDLADCDKKGVHSDEQCDH